MAMQVLGGIEFWINDDGRVRLFTVAEADKTKAQKLLERRCPAVEFATWHPLPSGVITMLKLQMGDILEWSSFSIRLPDEYSGKDTAQNRGDHRCTSQATMNGMNMAGSNLISAPRLLIAKDDRSTSLAVAKLAKKAGFAITSAMSLDRAFLILRGEGCDCLTLDLNLEVETGVQVISAIIQAAPGKPIVSFQQHRPGCAMPPYPRANCLELKYWNASRNQLTSRDCA